MWRSEALLFSSREQHLVFGVNLFLRRSEDEKEAVSLGACIFCDMPDCGGCRTCEIACSFHHTNEFNPSVSSISVIDKLDEAGYQISFAVKGAGRRIACDGCKDIEVPLCMRYCKEREKLGEMISKVLSQKNGIDNE